MPARQPRLRSTTRPRSIRPARCATWRSTDRMPTSSSSTHKGEAMRHNTTAVTIHFSWPVTSIRVLWAVALLFAWLPGARAQQGEEQQGVDQGNYNIKQSVEFGVRLVSITGDQNAYDTFI